MVIGQKKWAKTQWKKNSCISHCSYKTNKQTNKNKQKKQKQKKPAFRIVFLPNVCEQDLFFGLRYHTMLRAKG